MPDEGLYGSERVCEVAMKLADWARLEGIHPKTAYRWFRTGQMPVPAEKVASGSILVHDPKYNKPAAGNGRVVVYARVSSHDQKSSLDGQVSRAVTAAATQGLSVDEVVTEVGSGLNGKRKKLSRLLADPSVTTIVVEHRDRLTRFGVDHLQSALGATGPRVTAGR